MIVKMHYRYCSKLYLAKTGVLLGRMAFAMQPHPAEGKPSGSQRQVFGASLLTPWSKNHESQ